MTSTAFMRLANVGVRGLRPYEPGKPVDELQRELGITDVIKLASNENPLGPSTLVDEVLSQGIELGRYPDGSGHALKQCLATDLGVTTQQITLGNGSNEVFELLARVFLHERANVVCSAHAFAVYPLVTQAAGAQLRIVPALPADHPQQPLGHDLASFAGYVDENTRLIFIANPNNPTGTWIEPAALEALMQQLPSEVLVVLDEAYCEYQDPALRADSLGLLQRYPNLLITRTFSKVFGLAALRVGFAVSHPEVADLLNRVRQPFNNNALALKAAELAWQDQAHVAASLAINAEGMGFYREQLGVMGLKLLPSQANFLCVDFARPAQAIYQAMLARGVILRPLASYGLPNCLRITVGTPDENERCLAALQEVL